MTIRLGLTGGIATGKSTISNMLKQWGYPIIDADEIAKQLMRKGGQAYNKVVEAFSFEILLDNGEIDRVKLGEIIFQNDAERNRLNQIVHPTVHAEMESIYSEYARQNQPLVVFDVPLLLDGEMKMELDYILVVAVDEQTQLERLMKRNGFTRAHAMARIHSQMSQEERVSYADFVIDNGGTLEETVNQLKKVMTSIQKS